MPHPVLELPRLHHTKLTRLIDRGIVAVEDVPDDFPLTDKQALVRDCILQNGIHLGPGLKAALQTITFPAYYLDFESVQTCIPLYPGIAPYTQIPTQYSLHLCSAPGKIRIHKSYLADPQHDCRRELAEKLIKDSGSKGSILTYSSFEKRIITELKALFPDLAVKLTALLNRLVDLHAILSQNYYHPDFAGSYSLKQVAPVLIPDLSYNELEIAEGGTASAIFAYMARGRYSAAEMKQIRQDLLRYCEQDTLAMVRLHVELWKQSR